MLSVKEVIDKINKEVEKIRKQGLAILESEAVKSVKRNFEEGGRPKWEPSVKRGNLKGTNTLVVTGTLSNISAKTDSARGIVTIQSNPASRAYAKIQHEGGTIFMPARTVKRRKVTAGKNKGKSVFASKRHKKTTETQTKPYKIKIPARPFMTVPSEDWGRIINKISTVIKL